MGQQSAIGWTDATWNPWYGCDPVSPGCDNCYMFREMRKYGRDPETVTRSKTKFSEPLKWKEPKLVFTCSWGDFFHKKADEWRADAWDIIRRTPHLTYQILTKRASRIARHLPPDWGDGWPHVWLGTSAESQEWADRRIPLILAVPAAVHFVSAEPLLSPLQLSGPWHDYLAGWTTEQQHVGGCSPDSGCAPGCPDVVQVHTRKLSWVIAGGESGEPRREMDLNWVRSIRDQCVAAGTAFHLKQLGGPAGHARAHDEAVLDGRTWQEFPRAA